MSVCQLHLSEMTVTERKGQQLNWTKKGENKHFVCPDSTNNQSDNQYNQDATTDLSSMHQCIMLILDSDHIFICVQRCYPNIHTEMKIWSFVWYRLGVSEKSQFS